jgi:hypothetical protein
MGEIQENRQTVIINSHSPRPNIVVEVVFRDDPNPPHPVNDGRGEGTIMAMHRFHRPGWRASSRWLTGKPGGHRRPPSSQLLTPCRLSSAVAHQSQLEDLLSSDLPRPHWQAGGTGCAPSHFDVWVLTYSS